MRIVVEIGWGHKAGGARRVAINTLLAMAKQRPDHEYIVCSNSIYDQLHHPGISQMPLKVPPLVPQVVWDQFLFPHLAVPLAVRKVKPDVIFYTNNIVSYWGTDTPAVVNIYDMTPFVLPESYGRYHGAYQRAYFRFAARKASKIITISENSKEDICQILRVPESKVVVVPLAGDIKDQVDLDAALATDLQTKFGISGPFILYVGAIHPRKNVGRLIQAYSRLKTSNNIPHQLVMAGAFRWMAENFIQTPEFTSIKGHLLFTKRVSDSDLVALYSKCDVFVYPSLYEGFGLPVLEAMSLNAPVVTSNTSSLPEVAGDAAILVDPLDIEEIAQGIWRVLSQPGFADKLRRKGLHRAGKFSWEKTGLKVLSVLESII